MKKTLIVLVSVMVCCVSSAWAQGLYLISDSRIGQQNVRTYKPIGFGSSYSSGISVGYFHMATTPSFSSGGFVSADDYIARVSAAVPSASLVPIRRLPRPTDPDPTTHQGRVPLPDATWMLLVLALGYVAGVALRRRKAQAGA